MSPAPLASSVPQHRSQIPQPLLPTTFNQNNATQRNPRGNAPKGAQNTTRSAQQIQTTASQQKRKTRSVSAPKSSRGVKFQLHNTLAGANGEIVPPVQQRNVNMTQKRKSFAKQKSTLMSQQGHQPQHQEDASSQSKSLDTAFKQFPQHSTNERIVLNFKQIGPDLRHSSKKSLSRQLRDSVKTLCLSQNNIESVRGVAFFRSLENLSLAHNKICSMSDLQQYVPLEVRTKQLRHVILRGNPVCSHPDYKHECLRMFPVLETLDQERITPEDRNMALNSSRKLLFIYLKLLYIIEEHHTHLHKENLHLHVKLELYRRAYGTHQAFCRYDMPVEFEQRIMSRYREGKRLVIRHDGTEWIHSGEILRDDGIVSSTEELLFENVGRMNGERKRTEQVEGAAEKEGQHEQTLSSTQRLVGYSSQQPHDQCTIPQIIQLINQMTHPNLMGSIVQQWKNNIEFSSEEIRFGNRLMLLLLHLYESQNAGAPDIDQVRALRQEIEQLGQAEEQTLYFQVYSSNGRFLKILRMLLVKKVNLIQEVLRARAKILNTNLFALTVPGVVGGPGRSYSAKTHTEEEPQINAWVNINNGKTPLEEQEEQRHERLGRSVKALQQLIEKLNAARVGPGAGGQRERAPTKLTSKPTQIQHAKPRTSAFLQSKRIPASEPVLNKSRNLERSQHLASNRQQRLMQVQNKPIEMDEPVQITHSRSVSVGVGENQDHEAIPAFHKAQKNQVALREKAERIQNIIQSHRQRLGQLDGGELIPQTELETGESQEFEDFEIESIEGEEIDEGDIVFDGHTVDAIPPRLPREEQQQVKEKNGSRRKRRTNYATRDDPEETVRRWNQLLLDRRTEKQLDALAQAHHESQLRRKAFYALREGTHEQRRLRIIFLSWQIFAHRRQCYRKAVHKIRHARRAYWAKQCMQAWHSYTKKKRHLHREEQLKRYHEQRHRSTSRGKERILKGGIPIDPKTEKPQQSKRMSVDTRLIRLELAKSLQENIRSQQRILKTLQTAGIP
uniref:Leucine-rich repeat-containing protein 51 n=1 Tax=Percolomonas cosmopolitus TaxID=63605 RepID=A0A7S1PEZ2_9EUKA|mmetsp:Transcript_2409/g.9067  ORF Transcript_2409/g.9067 Transcript_2409/m.9067 type:complete len:1011 (+) Transcript_2409:29-3061(+)